MAPHPNIVIVVNEFASGVSGVALTTEDIGLKFGNVRASPVNVHLVSSAGTWLLAVFTDAPNGCFEPKTRGTTQKSREQPHRA